jgi:hypothetical protein
MVREKVLYVFEEVLIVFRDSRHLSPPIAILSVEVEHPNNNMQCLFSITGPSGSSFLLEATDSTFSTLQPIPHLLQGVLILAK